MQASLKLGNISEFICRNYTIDDESQNFEKIKDDVLSYLNFKG